MTSRYPDDRGASRLLSEHIKVVMEPAQMLWKRTARNAYQPIEALGNGIAIELEPIRLGHPAVCRIEQSHNKSVGA